MGYDMTKTGGKFRVNAEHAGLVAVKLEKVGYGCREPRWLAVSWQRMPSESVILHIILRCFRRTSIKNAAVK